MIRIGLDLSYNSTGMVLFDEEDHTTKFIQICPGEEKHSLSAELVTYERVYSDTDDFTINELNRIRDAKSLASKIRELVKKYCGTTPCEIRIEAPLMTGFMKGSKRFRNSNDMVIVNKIVTMYLMDRPLTTFKILPATKIKKAFTGKGNGKKEKMIEEFFKRLPNFDNTGKVDDLIDAYALAISDFE